MVSTFESDTMILILSPLILILRQHPLNSEIILINHKYSDFKIEC